MSTVPRRALCLALVGLVAGCARGPVFEERYRIFHAADLGVAIRPTEPPEEIARRFLPVAAVNAALEQLAREGFTLAEIKPIAGAGGATLMIFRRPLPSGYRPTFAPMEFTGLYVAVGEEPGKATYYFFVPRLSGYTIHRMAPEGYATHEAEWDGRALGWQSAQETNSVVLSDDGRSILHTINPLAGGLRLTIEARRVRSLD